MATSSSTLSSSSSAEYRASAAYIASLRKRPPLLFMRLGIAMALMGYAMFSTPDIDPQLVTMGFIGAAVVACCLGYLHLSQIRTQLNGIDTLRFSLSDAGVCIRSPQGEHHIPYTEINAVTVHTSKSSGEVNRIQLQRGRSQSQLPGLEHGHAFVGLLKQRLGSGARFVEKQSLFG